MNIAYYLMGVHGRVVDPSVRVLSHSWGSYWDSLVKNGDDLGQDGQLGSSLAGCIHLWVQLQAKYMLETNRRRRLADAHPHLFFWYNLKRLRVRNPDVISHFFYFSTLFFLFYCQPTYSFTIRQTKCIHYGFWFHFFHPIFHYFHFFQSPHKLTIQESEKGAYCLLIWKGRSRLSLSHKLMKYNQYLSLKQSIYKIKELSSILGLQLTVQILKKSISR